MGMEFNVMEPTERDSLFKSRIRPVPGIPMVDLARVLGLVAS